MNRNNRIAEVAKRYVDKGQLAGIECLPASQASRLSASRDADLLLAPL